MNPQTPKNLIASNINYIVDDTSSIRKDLISSIDKSIVNLQNMKIELESEEELKGHTAGKFLQNSRMIYTDYTLVQYLEKHGKALTKTLKNISAIERKN